MSTNYASPNRLFFAPHSLRFQLLLRSLLILAVLLVLIGLMQYVIMRDVLYKNKVASLQSQVMSIPLHAWEQQDVNVEDRRFLPPIFFIPESNLVFVTSKGDYVPLSNWPGGIKPVRLDVS